MTKEQWEIQKYKDHHKRSTKQHHFKSRPLTEFQKDLEAGKVRHLFPTMFAKERVKRHQIRPSDVPYIQRTDSSYNNKDVNVGYIPDGMTPHQWHEMQRQERKSQKKKNFGAFGPQSFQSRSLQSFQKDLQDGKVRHLMPVMFAKQQVKKGKIREEEVPYMQRGGKWDNSDVRNAKNKLEWTETDKQYAAGEGPFAAFFKGKQQKAPTTMEKETSTPKKKGFFGLFP